jgi:hypothetical protein
VNGPERGPGPRERRADEAYHTGREEGFDRGYEEGFDAARRELAGQRIPASAPAMPAAKTGDHPATSAQPAAKRLVRGGILLALAYAALRILRTWPGMTLLVVLAFALAPLIQLGVWIGVIALTVVVGKWAVRTGRKAVADSRSGIVQVRAIARSGTQRLRSR